MLCVLFVPHAWGGGRGVGDGVCRGLCGGGVGVWDIPGRWSRASCGEHHVKWCSAAAAEGTSIERSGMALRPRCAAALPLVLSK